MSDLRPLLDESLSGDVADLLRSAAADAPPHPEAGQARVVVAMVASPRIEVVASAPKTMGGAPFHLALAGLVLVIGSAAFVASETERSAPTKAHAPPTTALLASAQPEAPSLDVDAVPASSLLPALRVEDLPSASRTTIASSAPAAPRTAAVDELAMIDAARADLTAGHPDAALQRVAAYRALGRARTYAVEADVIEIEALSSLGRAAEARARADRFLKRHPRSPYEHRIQCLLQEL